MDFGFRRVHSCSFRIPSSGFRTCLLFATALLLTACAPKLTVSPAPNLIGSPIRSHADTASAWRLIQNGEFDRAERILARLPLDSSTPLMAAQGMLDVYHGRPAAATGKLLRVVESRADSALRQFAYAGLQSIYFDEERYPALESLEATALGSGLTSDSSSLVLARAIKGIGPMEIEPTASAAFGIKTSIAGSPVTSVIVNGGRPEEFWFDTGASYSVISEELARRHHVRILSEQEADAGTATARKVKFRVGLIDRLLIGYIEIRNVPVMVMSAKDLSLGIPFMKISGIIGWSVMSRFRTTIDYAKRRMTMRNVERTPGPRNLFFFGGAPLIPVAVDGNGPLHFIFDTGAGASMLTPAGVEKLTTPPTMTSAAGCIGGAGGSDAGRIKMTQGTTLTVAGHELYPMQLAVTKLPVEDLPVAVDGLLGENVFHKFIVTIDGPNGIVTLQKQIK